MTLLRPDVHKAIAENSLSAVIFTDPFLPVTRQSRRNLLVAAFVALLIAVLGLEVEGFLGLSARNANLGNDLAGGLAFFVVAYFLIVASVHMYVDYNAWQFRKERQATEPYLDLIRLIEQQVSVLVEQIKNATEPMRTLDVPTEADDMRFQIEMSKQFQSTVGQLSSIEQKVSALMREVTPLIDNWRGTVDGMQRLKPRLRARIISLWVLDIAFPILLAFLAMWSTYDGVASVIARIAG